MIYEVEVKYPVENLDDFRAKLEALEAREGEPLEQKDAYWNHPSRDFGETDEAFRLRSLGDENRMTYKGPLVDSTTKTRQEIEFTFQSGKETLQQCHEMLTALGFQFVDEVVKLRTPYFLDWRETPITIVIDEVQELGTYIEIESEADEENLNEVREVVLNLADHLGLKNQERRSYLVLQMIRKGVM